MGAKWPAFLGVSAWSDNIEGWILSHFTLARCGRTNSFAAFVLAFTGKSNIKCLNVPYKFLHWRFSSLLNSENLLHLTMQGNASTPVFPSWRKGKFAHRAIWDSTFAAWLARTPAAKKVEAAGPNRNHGPRFFHTHAIAWWPKQKFVGLHPFCSSRPLYASAAEGHFPLGGHPYVHNIVPRRRCASQLHRSFPAPLLIVFSFPLHVAISKASGSWAMSSDLTTTPPGRDRSLTCSHPSFTVAAKWNWVN